MRNGSDEPNGVGCNFEVIGLPIEKLVKCFHKNCGLSNERRIEGRHRNALNESSGSRISSAFNPWNSMNAGIPLADSGSSYLISCLIDVELEQSNERKCCRKPVKEEHSNIPRPPSIRLIAPIYKS